MERLNLIWKCMCTYIYIHIYIKTHTHTHYQSYMNMLFRLIIPNNDSGGNGANPTGVVGCQSINDEEIFYQIHFRNTSNWKGKPAFTELFHPSQPLSHCSKSAFMSRWQRPPRALPPAYQNSGGHPNPVLSVSIVQEAEVFSFLKESWIWSFTELQRRKTRVLGVQSLSRLKPTLVMSSLNIKYEFL